jgi:hypothetical protein
LTRLEVFRNIGPHLVAADHVFLLGDMRRNSKDSRMDGDYPLAKGRRHRTSRLLVSRIPNARPDDRINFLIRAHLRDSRLK